MNATVIGLGLIGGSMAIELKALGYHVSGVDNSIKHQEQALDLGIVDEIVSEINYTSQDVIFIAIPVDYIADSAAEILDHISWKTIVIDLGSTKANICNRIRSHAKRENYIPAHPLAGTEFSGPQAAFINLFRGNKNIICEDELCSEKALERAVDIFNKIGMQSIFMHPDEHDKHMAYVSHLSHVSAFMLGLTVLDIEKDEKQIFNLASTGFQSTVRLAKSSPETWSAIFSENAENLGTALDSYINYLQVFRGMLDDKPASQEMLKKSNEIKRILNGISLNVMKLS